MRTWALLLGSCLFVAPVMASVNIVVEDVDGLAQISYQCTSGEVVRAFALDVTVDAGRILEVDDFFLGESTAAAQGYGIFPASFRDHVTVLSGTEATWDAPGYCPVADPEDDPAGTLPGLGSSGVTLELAALWDPAMLGAIPGPEGVLCSLRISEDAVVSVSANEARGGVMSADSEAVIDTTFVPGAVAPIIAAITGIGLEGDVITISFENGELEITSDLAVDWTGTGNTSGEYSESIEGFSTRFYRVQGP
jgi:hypothetical protein